MNIYRSNDHYHRFNATKEQTPTSRRNRLSKSQTTLLTKNFEAGKTTKIQIKPNYIEMDIVSFMRVKIGKITGAYLSRFKIENLRSFISYLFNFIFSTNSKEATFSMWIFFKNSSSGISSNFDSICHLLLCRECDK